MKAITEQHLAMFRRHMVEVVEMDLCHSGATLNSNFTMSAGVMSGPEGMRRTSFSPVTRNLIVVPPMSTTMHSFNPVRKPPPRLLFVGPDANVSTG